MKHGIEVGRVAALWRYPVKSMAAEPLERADLSWHGLAGDRRWAFLRDLPARNGFPWLTIRERPDLLHYRPWLAEPDRPDASPVLVTTPSGEKLDVADPALAAELGDGVRVLKLNRGLFDSAPLSVLSTRSVDGLSRLLGDAEVDPLRFRPNVLIEAVDTAPAYPEEAWIGATLSIGGARLHLDRRDKRCMIVNVDPVTARRDPGILRTIARQRDVCFGVYASPVAPGPVAVGDPVVLTSAER
ncbi:MOSC domain-containing protein [Catenuloplanes sp. NPDC051500]|uniref:MOSC domain-containing protein n=1 Tax=Catenuloplanes sp. NPDC051500 TaxID=3363959 RepID=UPI00378A5FE3